MGGVASASNVADQVAEISQSVMNDIDTKSESYNDDSTEFDFSGCKFERNVKIDVVRDNVVKAKQIVKALQDTQVTNDIAQKTVQSALAQTEFLSLGIADASNVASMTAAASTLIKQSILTTASSISDTTFKFKCDGTIVKGDFFLSSASKSNYFSDQTVQSKQVTQIKTKIDQSLQQTATAKAGGFGALVAMICAAIVCCVLARALTKKPKGGPMGAREADEKVKKSIFIAVGVYFIVMTIFLITSWGTESGPWYEPAYITKNMSSYSTGCIRVEDLIREYEQTIITLKAPPLRYVFPLFVKDGNMPISLFDMVCWKVVQASDSEATSNGGFNKATYKALRDKDGNWIYQPSKQYNNGKPLPSLFMLPMSTNGKNILLPGSYKSNTCKYFVTDPVVDLFKHYPCCATECPLCVNPTTDVLEASDDASDSVILAVPNYPEWKEYAKDKKGSSYVRYALCRYLQISCDTYYNDDDCVFFLDENSVQQEGIASNFKSNTYKIGGTIFDDSSHDAVKHGATLSGDFAKCRTFGQRWKDACIWIVSALTLMFFLLCIFINYMLKSRTKKKPSAAASDSGVKKTTKRVSPKKDANAPAIAASNESTDISSANKDDSAANPSSEVSSAASADSPSAADSLSAQSPAPADADAAASAGDLPDAANKSDT